MMILKSVPTSGQFCAVWNYAGRIWSGTYVWVDGFLYRHTGDDTGPGTIPIGEDESQPIDLISEGFYGNETAFFMVVA